MARLGIDSIEIGLYAAFLAQKRPHMVCFLEVTDPKTVNRKGNYENTKMVLLQCVEDTLNLNLKI
jgi:hypothetical protein